MRERTAELRETQLEVVRRLARAAELRDDDTGEHIERMGRLCERLALAAGFSAPTPRRCATRRCCTTSARSACPTASCASPAGSTRRSGRSCAHAEIGAAMLAGSPSPLIQLGEEIARTHHERWDGTGYPAGLRGEEIPLAGRICAVCDVFDALRSRRPYKEAWTLDEALAEIARPARPPLRPCTWSTCSCRWPGSWRPSWRSTTREDGPLGANVPLAA